MNRFLFIMAFLFACSTEHEAPQDVPDASEPPAEECAPDAAPALPLPQWPSVAWILTQPYGEACNAGHRASDNPRTLFMEHPETGRCTFACDLDMDLCAELDGRCDDLSLCQTIHVKGE